MKLSALPRVKLAGSLPTPLQEMRNFSRVVGGPRIFIKRDDVVVFLHTGGAAVTFAYKQPLRDFLSGRRPAWVIPPWSPEVYQSS